MAELSPEQRERVGELLDEIGRLLDEAEEEP